MLTHRRTYPWVYGGAGLMAVVVLGLMPALLSQLTSTAGFTPHGYCFLWEPGLLHLFVATDTLIGLSYVAISCALVALVYQTRRDIPFHWMFLAFGAFIVACGSTHFMDVLTLWVPVYWLAGVTKLVTAVASVATAIAVPMIIPRVRDLVQSARRAEEHKRRLEQANQELARLYAHVTELDELRSRFYANISHELRTPLTLILGPAERLLSTPVPEAEQRAALEVIQRNATTLLAHVTSLLEVARLEAGQLRPTYAEVDLAQQIQLCADQFRLLAQDRAITFTVDMATPVPAQVDPEQFQRILKNLLSNAFKFTPPGGRIRVGLRIAERQALVTVADSGPGVPPEQRERIFERFQQGDSGPARRYNGSGLGLFIVKELVGLHAGRVDVKDALGGGALFEVRLPLRAPEGLEVGPAQPPVALPLLELPAPPEPDEPALAPADPDDQRALVLVIEDHQDMRAFLRTTLAASHRVALAADGRAGLERARALRPDLIISDLMMPAMSGEQVLAAVMADPELRDTPVLLLTARADPTLRIRMLQAGARDYLIKPFSTAELLARAAQLIDAQRARHLLQRQITSQRADLAGLAEQLTHYTHELEQAIHARDVFLSIASHELKTPLTSMLGFAELLERRAARGGPLTERDQHTIRIIRDQALRLNRLIAGMLDLSRIDSGQLALEREPLELGALVRQVVDEARLGPQPHPIALELPEQPLMFNGDVLRLEQVIYNLLQNAIKYSPNGGAIEVRLAEQDGQAVLSVTDQGIGIPVPDLPRLFQRFYRASNVSPQQISGTGIGLYVIREIITRHSGSIAVASSVNQGSTFTVCLPLR